MSDAFLHGIEYIEIDDGFRAVETIRTSVIGLVGTAPDADADAWPLDTPVLVTGRRQLSLLGATGTLPAALNAIHGIALPWVVVVRVEQVMTEGATPTVDTAATQAKIIGALDVTTGQRSGTFAFLDARASVRVTPRILIAPGFSHVKAVAAALLERANKLAAVAIIDGPNTTDAAATAYANEFGSPRLYLIDPWVVTFDEVEMPASPYAAALMARSDEKRGWWWSVSNQVIPNILRPARPIEWAFNDPETQANYLNESKVATIIHEEGYRLWGNRSCSDDPKWRFLSVRRTADVINESLLFNHLWAVDRPITKTYLEDVVEGVNAFLRHARMRGAIINGKCWVDKELNTPDQIMQGRVFFDFDFTSTYPAERITFRSHMTDGYLEEVIP